MVERIDLLVILEEVLTAARENGLKSASGDSDFDKGKAMAYYDVLTIALEQAQLLNVDPAEIGLDGFRPEELLKRKAA